VLDFLAARGAAASATGRPTAGCHRVLVLDVPLVRDAAFALPHFVAWEWADPHYGTGNSLTCTLCRSAIEELFDPRDARRTFGTQAR
jgi:hypothetical protein